MSEVEIRQTTAQKGQRGSRRGQERRPTPPHRASWSTVIYEICKTDSEEPKNKSEFHCFKCRLIWVSVFRTGYKVHCSLLLSREIVVFFVVLL